MGEYADLYFRQEIMREYGFDPGSMYGDEEKNHRCPRCGKRFYQQISVTQHLKDKHKEPIGEQP